MKKIIRQLDKEKGIMQITIADERWYAKPGVDKNKNPIYKFIPSVTWIAGYYPKGVPFYKWLANKGWNEAEAIKNAAGNKGSKVHQAVELLILGGTVKMEDKLENKETGEMEALTLEEYEAILAFAEWFDIVKPKILAIEKYGINEKENYAGTIDLICEIEGKVWLIDFKTSQHIWPEHIIQVSAYKHSDLGKEHRVEKLGILQLGLKKNKIKKYRFTEVEDKFGLFLAAKQIWASENENVEPKVKDYPIEITLPTTEDVTDFSPHEKLTVTTKLMKE